MWWNASDRSIEVKKQFWRIQLRSFATTCMRKVGQRMCLFRWERSMITLFPPEDLGTTLSRLTFQYILFQPLVVSLNKSFLSSHYISLLSIWLVMWRVPWGQESRKISRWKRLARRYSLIYLIVSLAFMLFQYTNVPYS